MEKNKRIGIIGHFGGKENIADGQTIKTKILYEELNRAANWEIQKVDTYYKRKNPIKLLWSTMVCMLKNKDIIVLLSGNGMRTYFPVLYFFSKKFNKRIYHDVRGGNLDGYVDKYPEFKKYLNSFRVNWVETEGLKKKLEQYGIANCAVMPNFKRLQCIPAEELELTPKKIYRFCTFSRVMREKGIEVAIGAIQNINAEAGEIICELDIYGRIDEMYKPRFDEVIKAAGPAIKYCGTVQFDKSVEIIKNYYALLFPTFWRGEGFPGTVIDAFSAGLPVIATDWSCNSELIENKITGIIYPNDEIKTLDEAILWSIEETEAFTGMKKNCLKKAEEYQPEKHIEQIIEFISGFRS